MDEERDSKETDTRSPVVTPKATTAGPTRVSHMIGGNALSQLRALIATPPPAPVEPEQE